jgi:hypothetical protein
MLNSTQMNDLESNLDFLITKSKHPSAKHIAYKIYQDATFEVSIMVNNIEYSREFSFFQISDDEFGCMIKCNDGRIYDEVCSIMTLEEVIGLDGLENHIVYGLLNDAKI